MKIKNDDKIVNCLKEMVDRYGPSSLADDPYRTYKELIGTGAADRKTASAILYVFANGVLEHIDSDYNVSSLSETIRNECSLNKKMADRIAMILQNLYSSEHKKEWKSKDLEGLKDFLAEEFVCAWKGYAVWDAGNGTVDCHYEAEITLEPTEAISEDKELVKLIKKNPFMRKEAIHDLFSKRLMKYLDDEFEDYCTCDDYYQPVVEDFSSNMEYDIPEWCKRNGFEFVSCEGDGYDGGYEPKFRRGWY